MIIIFIGAAYKNMDPHVGFWCIQIQAVTNALMYKYSPYVSDGLFLPFYFNFLYFMAVIWSTFV